MAESQSAMDLSKSPNSHSPRARMAYNADRLGSASLGSASRRRVTIGRGTFVVAHIQVDRGPLHAVLRLPWCELDCRVDVLEGLLQDLGSLVGLHLGLSQGVVKLAAGGQDLDPLQAVVEGVLVKSSIAFSLSPMSRSAKPRVTKAEASLLSMRQGGVAVIQGLLPAFLIAGKPRRDVRGPSRIRVVHRWRC